MRPGHPSTTCRREMRDLVSIQNHWGFPEEGREREEEKGGGGRLRGGQRRVEGLCIPEFLCTPPPPPLISISSLHVPKALWLCGRCFDS